MRMGGGGMLCQSESLYFLLVTQAGYTALIQASSSGEVAVVNLLLAAKANMEVRYSVSSEVVGWCAVANGSRRWNVYQTAILGHLYIVPRLTCTTSFYA